MLASKGKSRITNRPTLLAGVDGRSSQSRRRRDLIRGYVSALGGPDKVSPTAMNDVVRAADLVAIAEKSRADALRGGTVDLSALIRLEGAADRAVRRLSLPQSGKSPAANGQAALFDHLAKNYGVAADDAEVDE
jgi:hypothetical protein